jgi:hypothetical protein
MAVDKRKENYKHAGNEVNYFFLFSGSVGTTTSLSVDYLPTDLSYDARGDHAK